MFPFALAASLSPARSYFYLTVFKNSHRLNVLHNTGDRPVPAQAMMGMKKLESRNSNAPRNPKH